MPKKESTAVNDLINLVATATPRKPAPDEDLMFQEPPKKTKSVSIPRMTATVPPVRGAGEIEPLPRGRGAMGTQKNEITNDDGSHEPQVRISTAPPSRQVTIPPMPIGRASTPPPLKSSAGFDLSAPSTVGHNLPASSIGITVPATPLVDRPTKPSLPPPTRTSAPPAMLPVAAPFETRPSQDMTSDQPWFDESRRAERVTGPIHEETWVGTVQTPKVPSTTTHWLSKLAVPMGAMIVIGIFVGGYLAFDGEGGHKRAPKTPAASAVVGAPIASPGADESKPEPTAAVAAVDPTKAEPAPAAAATEPAAKQPAPTAVAKPEPAVAQPAVAQPAITGVRPVFVDVRIDSKPEGATVMVVEKGKTNFLGTTPLSTALDPARQYDLVLTYKDRPTQLEHLDPATTTKLMVTMHHGDAKPEVA